MSKPWTPQRLLVPCPDCGQTVLRGLWRGDMGRFRKIDPPQTPLGAPHDCDQAIGHWYVVCEQRYDGDEALSRWLEVLRYRWRHLWIFHGWKITPKQTV